MEDLAARLVDLRDDLRRVTLSLDLDGTADARTARLEVVDQIAERVELARLVAVAAGDQEPSDQIS